MTAAIEPSSGTKDQQGAPAAEPTTGAETPFSFGASLRQFGTSIVDQGSRILSSGQELVITQAGNLRDAVSSASEQVYERSTRALRYSLRALA